jgi:hypothetical protein
MSYTKRFTIRKKDEMYVVTDKVTKNSTWFFPDEIDIVKQTLYLVCKEPVKVFKPVAAMKKFLEKRKFPVNAHFNDRCKNGWKSLKVSTYGHALSAKQTKDLKRLFETNGYEVRVVKPVTPENLYGPQYYRGPRIIYRKR